MKALDIISQFNRFDGKDVTKETLKAFRGRVQQYTDSVGHGPYMNQLRDILTRVGRAISVMDKNREEAVHLEVKPVKIQKKKKATAPKLKYAAADESMLNGLECIQKDDGYDSKPLDGVGDTTYKVITDKILALIKKDGLIWRKPWNTNHQGKEAHAHNYVTKTYYRGGNFYLNYLLMSDFSSPYFFTFKQVTDLGGKVIAGSKGWPVIYFKWLYKKTNGPLVDEKEATANGKLKPGYEKFPALFYYTVFNYEQTEGLKVKPFKAIKISEPEKIESCEAIIKHMPKRPVITNLPQDRAFYSWSTDKVTMPLMNTFEKEQYYYSVLFHELIHSTGHESRVGRKFGAKGTKAYAFEELIAELGASYLCGESGIFYFTMKNSAAYIKSWSSSLVKEMNDDPKFFLKAAANAEKASEFILSGKPAKEKKNEGNKPSELKVGQKEPFVIYWEKLNAEGTPKQIKTIRSLWGRAFDVWNLEKKNDEIAEKLLKSEFPFKPETVATILNEYSPNPITPPVKDASRKPVKSTKSKKKRKEASVPGVKASVSKAIEDLVQAKPDKYGKKAMAMQMLYSKFNSASEVELEEESLIEKLLNKEGWIEYERSSPSGQWFAFYSLTESGKQVLESITGRLTSLRVKKQGGELFPNLNGVRQPKSKLTAIDGLVSASELSGLNFKVFDLDGKYRKDFQRLHSDTQVMVWGSPGSGKTVYLLEFAQYLADKLGLNVLYVANEEFGRSTFVQKIKQFNIGHPRLKFSRTLNEKVIDQFDAIIFDSINSLGYTLADWKKLVERNPNKLMIPVVQSTKDGDFRGGKDWEHEVDVAGEIKNRKLILRKNRLDSNNAKRAEQLNKEAAIEEAKKKAEIRNAVKASIDKPKPPTLTAQAA